MCIYFSLNKVIESKESNDYRIQVEVYAMNKLELKTIIRVEERNRNHY